MKTLRVVVLMTVLLAGATTRTPPADEPVIVAKADNGPDCIFVNGAWFCP